MSLIRLSACPMKKSPKCGNYNVVSGILRDIGTGFPAYRVGVGRICVISPCLSGTCQQPQTILFLSPFRAWGCLCRRTGHALSGLPPEDRPLSQGHTTRDRRRATRTVYRQPPTNTYKRFRLIPCIPWVTFRINTGTSEQAGLSPFGRISFLP